MKKRTANHSIAAEKLIETARRYRGVKFAHQGRNPKYGLDCGGLVLVVARELRLTALEELGYALFPQNGRFERLMNENAVDLNFECAYPYQFTGEEFQPGHLLTFDYGIGEGVRHIAIVTKFDGRYFWIIEAHHLYNVCEHPLRHPFFQEKTTIKAWALPGVVV